MNTSKNSCDSYVEIGQWDVHSAPTIRTRCPRFDKNPGTKINLTRQMAYEIIAELTRLFPERRTGNDRRGPVLKEGS